MRGVRKGVCERGVSGKRVRGACEGDVKGVVCEGAVLFARPVIVMKE